MAAGGVEADSLLWANEYELSALLFNVSAGSSREGLTEEEEALLVQLELQKGLTDDQSKGIQIAVTSDDVKNADNLFVLAQDCLCGQRVATLGTVLGIGDTDPFCNKEAGTFPRKKAHHVWPVEPIPSDFFTQNCPQQDRQYLDQRLWGAKVTLPDGTCIVLVSYHGIYKTDKKEGAFRALVNCVKKVQAEKECHGVIIGGDFNFAMKDAMSLGVKGVVFAPQTDIFNKSLDYVVFWPSALVRVTGGDPKLLKWNFDDPMLVRRGLSQYTNVVNLPKYNLTNTEKKAPFDHPRLLFRFKIKKNTGEEEEDLGEKMAKLRMT